LKLIPRHPSHPVARLAGVLTRLPRYLNLAQRLARDGELAAARKVALAAGIAYVVSPVDLVPGIIPVLGQLDDLAALLLGLRQALNGCSPESRAEHLEHAGLSESALDADIHTIAVVTMWLGVSAARLGARALALPVRTALAASARIRRRLEPDAA
jgi:uncharacterized membrane protein YkvA (DUF1232 family)